MESNMIFLKGKPAERRLINGGQTPIFIVVEGDTEEFINADDIKRAVIANVDIYKNHNKANLINTKAEVCVTTIARPVSEFYILTDPIETIAAALNRDAAELSSMLLELEVK